MRRVQGSKGVALLECVNPKKGKYRLRWDVREEEDSASYAEAEFTHLPTVEEVEAAIGGSDSEATDEELLRIGEALGYERENFLKRYEKVEAARVAADPFLQLMEVVREQHLNAPDVPDKAALRVPDTFFTFRRLCKMGKQVAKGTVLHHNGKLWRVVQVHTPMEIYPPSSDTASLYARIDPAHEGTADDPIPYEQMMAFESGKYYEQYGVVYLCVLTTATGYPNDLRDLPTIVQEVK